MSYRTEEDLQRKMLQRVGILSKEKTALSGEDSLESLLDTLFSFLRISTSMKREDPLLRRIEKLEETVEELKKEKGRKMVPSKVDLIYLKFKTDLEKKHLGRVVAIDVESEQIVGIGNSILEAYHEAKKKTSKSKFSYRRVGVGYVHRL